MTTTSARRVAPCGTETAYRRHRRRHEPIDDTCRRGRNAVEAQREQRKYARHRQEYLQAREGNLTRLCQELTASGVRVFHGIRCADCKAGLHNGQGEPRWEIQWPMRFVCLGGCQGGGRR